MPNATPESIAKAIKALGSKRLLIGIPGENNQRPGEKIGNVLLGYVHEFGSPAKNIPSRAFLRPGVEAVVPEIGRILRSAAQAALNGDLGGIDRAFAAAGQTAVDSVKNRIEAGIPPPLAQSTVTARRLRLSGVHYRVRMAMVEEGWSRSRIAAYMAARGMPPPPKRVYLRKAQTPADAIPLKDTGDLLKSLTYVIRDN
jgi:hypothetical protein